MKNRVKYCDALKAMSIVLVILIHVFAIYRDIYFNSNKLYYTIISYGDSFTRVAVPIFFMITGAFMLGKKPEKSYKEYLFKRIPKLVIPLIIFSVIYYIYESYKSSQSLSILRFFQEVTTYGGVKYHFWFMYEMIRIYLLIPFISVLAKSLKRKELKNLIILIFIMGNLINMAQLFSWKYGLNLFYGVSLSSFAICINYLLLGYYLYKYNIKEKTRKKIYILGIISILLIPVFDLLYNDSIRSDISYVITSIFPILPSIATFILFKNNYANLRVPDRLEKIITTTSTNSLYIYMIHVIILEYVNKYLALLIPQDRFIHNIILIPITLIITFILSYIGAIIFDYFYKKIAKTLTKLLRCNRYIKRRKIYD